MKIKTMEDKKSLAQLIGEAASAQCKECDGKGWTVVINKFITYPQCKTCNGQGKINNDGR
jgi:DnaJ-class molecular chaperone